MNYSKKPIFKKIPSRYSPIYDVSWRLMVTDKDGKVYADGTCVLVAKNLAITAKHVAENFLKKYGVGKEGNIVSANFNLWAIQMLKSDDLYAIWDVAKFWLSPHTDVAVLQLKPYCENAAKCKNTKSTSINLFPPSVGSRVVGFGYRGLGCGSINFSKDGTRNIVVNDDPRVTVGEVVEVFKKSRDKTLLRFPCYQVSFRSEGGMSGGPVFSEKGELCGLICAGNNDECEDHISYVCSLWPMMGTVIQANRGSQYPRDVSYPMIDLAKDKIISAVGWEKIKITSAEAHL